MTASIIFMLNVVLFMVCTLVSTKRMQKRISDLERDVYILEHNMEVVDEKLDI